MIQIDDAGSGSLIGGTCIGAIRKETMEYRYDIIPVELYKGSAFTEKKYLDYVTTIVSNLFRELNVDKKEEIHVCRGYMFDELRKWLSRERYNYLSCKIDEPLQTIIEETFESYCLDLGLYKDYIRFNKYPFHFHTILKWVYADYENRKELCKTGWKSWKKYGNLDTIIKDTSIQKNNIICLRCGNPIIKNTKVKAITYISNRKTTLLLHENC
ncbi:hypothetical protein [Proteiniborus sp. MB09-C3]|uniref:hypothetical protein n=1 Tax=Proteiniborus sp. MB09-C3 TaxID=3050072 RepID=UPI002552EAB7|nr:hypothetical protein [Proteiniborus sp. MB09-C3]WIV10960.1 hypothetical protein QO263_12440 [Proteiniborus sp. MB09-C3]